MITPGLSDLLNYLADVKVYRTVYDTSSATHTRCRPVIVHEILELVHYTLAEAFFS